MFMTCLSEVVGMHYPAVFDSVLGETGALPQCDISAERESTTFSGKANMFLVESSDMAGGGQRNSEGGVLSMLRQKHNNNQEPAAEPPGAPQALLEQAPEPGVARGDPQGATWSPGVDE